MTAPRDLRDPAFLALLARIARRAKADFALGPRSGAALRLPRGGSAFREHRRYAPGDEPRTIDWNVYARLGEPFVKVFEPEEAGSLGIVLDASPSMVVGGALEAAARIAAAFGYVVLAQPGAAVALAGAGDFEVHRGPAGLDGLLRRLSEVEARGGGSLSGAARKLDRFRAAHGLLVTDGEPPEEVDRALPFLPRGRALCVQVLARGDFEPDLEEEARLFDPEGGSWTRLRPSEDLLARYRRLARVRAGEVEAVVRRRGAAFARVFAEDPFERTILALFERARTSVRR